MTAPWLRGWSRRGVPVAAGGLLLIYLLLRIQIVLYDRRIQRDEATLARLRPAVVEAAQARELGATVAAQQRFAETLRASAIAWGPVFQRLAALLPPTMVLHTVAIDGARMTLHGVLRVPPADPQAYLATVAAALKRHGVFRAVTIAVAPRTPDDPAVVRVDLIGELQ
ncbi:MAG: hypothetical protein HY600_02835 [Candidatus Omnitrophica bacterium]|nr:hypothetical protein [Candidatus Omnitrophota bacterium]